MPAKRIPQIYFAQASPPPGRLGPVKIGHAVDVVQRLRNVRQGCPYPVLLDAQLPGLRHHERLLHKMFAKGRIHGEWFDPRTAGLREFIHAADVYTNVYLLDPKGEEADFTEPSVAIIERFYATAERMDLTKGERKSLLALRAECAAALAEVEERRESLRLPARGAA